jgi:hydroxyacyl-ACP dehydratase HTD2-like protein with hotdog domain
MLSALRSQLQCANGHIPGETIKSFTYRNLAPLYVGEEMRVCVRRDTIKEGKMEVWIEGNGGGYAVKGTALVGRYEKPAP